MGIDAIRPKGYVIPDKRKIVAELERYGAIMEREAKQYPAWRAWTSTPPKTGPRAGGRRTGQLGRGWSRTVSSIGGSVTMRIQNPVSYAPYVQGSRQARAMAARSWVTIIAIAERNTPALQRALAEAGIVRVK
jgi:hypothetical protein